MAKNDLKSGPSALRVLAVAAAAGAVLGGAALVIRLKASAPASQPAAIEIPAENSMETKSAPSAALSSTAAPPVDARREARSHPPTKAKVDFDSGWKEFQARFGRGLQESSRDGRLLAARGTIGQGRESPEFRPNVPARVKARAQEILDSASSLLGIRDEMPLGEPLIAEGEVTAQVTYRQTYDGLPLAPQGAVRVDLGPKGELLALESSYQPGLQVGNSLRLTESEARERAIAGAGETGQKVEGGGRVVWIVSRSGAAAEGRYAYQFFIQGQQVVVDAGDGSILFRRTRRTD